MEAQAACDLDGTGSPDSSTAYPLSTIARRAFLLAFILGAEALLASLYLDGASLGPKTGAITGFIRDYGAWLVRGMIGCAALFATSTLLVCDSGLTAFSRKVAATRIGPAWLTLHFATFALFAALSRMLYGQSALEWPSDVTAMLWIAAATLAVILLARAAAPLHTWAQFLSGTRNLIFFAAIASAVACFTGALSHRLWEPATRITFMLVQSILHPLVAELIVEPTKMQIGTDRFSTIIAPECSGLEGAALMLVFALLWLILCRKQIRFPHAFLLVPVGIVALFILNAARIAALILIGHAGARVVANRGFHSQAGWIALILSPSPSQWWPPALRGLRKIKPLFTSMKRRTIPPLPICCR